MKNVRIALAAAVVAIAAAVFFAMRGGRADADAGDAPGRRARSGRALNSRIDRGAPGRGRRSSDDGASGRVGSRIDERAGKIARPTAQRKDPVPKPRLFDDAEEDDDFTPEERELSQRIEAALDKEDLAAAVACVASARECPNVEVRQAMVDALGWFGARALPEITSFLCDADEDIRESAKNEWSMALSDIESDSERISIAELALSALEDEDALEDISTEYIGVDEKLAVESLLRVIEGGDSEPGIAKAKETYEFVTGEEFVSREEAERWIAEEYEPPEDGREGA